MKTKQFRGYTLDQLETRRLVTQIKIELEKERLRQHFTPSQSSIEQLSMFTRISSLAQSALSAFSSIKQIITVVKSMATGNKA